MEPAAQAAIEFAQRHQGDAVIGLPADIAAIIEGKAGTWVSTRKAGIEEMLIHHFGGCLRPFFISSFAGIGRCELPRPRGLSSSPATRPTPPPFTDSPAVSANPPRPPVLL